MSINKIIEGDSFLVMKELPSECIDIIITSPPYNAAHNYDNYNDNRDFSDYIDNMTQIFKECYRILKKGGRICVNVPFAIKNKKTKNVSFISHHIAAILNEIGFKDFEWITWHKGKNMNHFQGNNTAWGSWKSPSCPSFRPLGEAIMVFYKEEKQHRGNKEKIDITGEEFKEWTKNTWYFNDDNNNAYEGLMCIPNDAKKNDHPAPYPNELVERLLKLYSYKDDIVLDPFNGIGTTTYVAEKMNRKYIGIELSKKYCDIAISRLERGIKMVHSSETASLVNSSNNEDTLNVVFPYKESFSPNLVPYLVERYNIKKTAKLLDPFLGTGSVFINNIVEKCYGFDTSPLAMEISLAKMTKLSNTDHTKAKKTLAKINPKEFKNYEYPNWPSYEKYAPKEKYKIIMNFIRTFDSETEELRRFVKYVVISNLDKIFDYKRDGNGIKYRKSKIVNSSVLDYLKELLTLALNLKKSFDKENEKEINFYNESIVKTDRKINNIDMVVTSPPYANMFDYFEVYKMELWTSGLINSYQEWRQLKKSALRSNKNTDIKKEEILDNDLLQVATKKMKKNDVDNTTISMVNNYFYDMKIVMEKMYNYLNKNGYMFIVVGNSFYGGVPIITDEILISEAVKIGFSQVDMIVSRKLSTSSQQMKIISDENRIYLRESIIVLRKDK